MAYIYLTRTQAARVIERLRTAIAESHASHGHGGDGHIRYDYLARILRDETGGAVPDLSRCEGEHHAYVDNCMTCAPRWGWVGPEVKIR